MREHRNDPKRLKDMVQAIDTIFEYVANRNMEEFVSDKRTYHAVIYNIMIMGEAANMLTLEFRESHPETQWRQVTNMHNCSRFVSKLRNTSTSFSTAPSVALMVSVTVPATPAVKPTYYRFT